MGCSSILPCFIFSSSSFGFFTWYLVSISWVSAFVALSMVFRYSLTPPVTSVSGVTPRDLEILSISWLVSVMFVTGWLCSCFSGGYLLCLFFIGDECYYLGSPISRSVKLFLMLDV